MEKLEPIGKVISYIYRYQRIFLDKELEPYGIGSGQFSFMMSLYLKDGVKQETFARMYKIDKATVARAIKKLEETGYVYRKQDAEDKRAYNVILTEKGKDIEAKMKEVAIKWNNIVLAGFSEEEKRLNAALFERMEQNITELFD
ncbi:Transcriptional regulator, MarR family [Methanosarcina sp. MTP4]|uniref:MarR family winged helix-turn-helix transcriptional regulator n=1 Tax=Methanosarcina sp. MTP4 TaxID=1434100 RepID=UPI0006156E53|nr:MarR family transcriptional regulator [Methanosarcina sp. MTP4]AKB25789.1 Transcriptional regulator, MarR family [Methanosarcina sp. MTP4]